MLLDERSGKGNRPALTHPVIEVSGFRKTYGRTVAVDDVSFEVAEGEIFGLIGPNGAGKTTTMECVEGLRRPDRGTVSVLGLDPFRDVYQLQDKIGVQLQQAQLQKRIKVWEAVHLWSVLYRKKREAGDRLLEQLGLAEKRNAWFMTLSGGQKQRLFIALALINDPQLVFLDELTTAAWTAHTNLARDQDLPARTDGSHRDHRRPIVDYCRGGLVWQPETGSAIDRIQPFHTRRFTRFGRVLIALGAVLSLVTIISIYREGGILRRLRATPLRPQTILTAHVLVKLLLAAFALGLSILAGKRYLALGPGAPVVGFTIALLISTWSILSIGFVIASIVPTARFAQPIGALILCPMIGLSGLFFPVEALPPVLRAIARVTPLTYAVSLMQGIWKGETWWAHAGDVAALVVVFFVCSALSAKVFRWD